MKIGILTVPFNNNYGGFLQAYALKKVLNDMGHEVVFVNRQREKSSSLKNRVYRFLVKLHIIKDFLAEHIRTISVNTDLFKSTYLSPITPAYFSSDELKKCLELGIDLFIVGSDQVWRYEYAQDSIEDYFFGFIDDVSIPRISYAASFGTDYLDYPTGLIDKIKTLLSRFQAISVREKSGQILLSSYFDVPISKVYHVLDPTLLLSSEDYKYLFKSIQPNDERYVLTYILDKDMLNLKELSKLCGDYNINRVDISAQTGNYKSMKVLEPVEKWLSLICLADYVVTDSFHGAVFSIIFHRPFIVLANPNRGLERLQSLLTMIGLEDRLIPSNELSISEAIKREINWSNVEQKLNVYRVQSIAYLNHSIQLLHN